MSDETQTSGRGCLLIRLVIRMEPLSERCSTFIFLHGSQCFTFTDSISTNMTLVPCNILQLSSVSSKLSKRLKMLGKLDTNVCCLVTSSGAWNKTIAMANKNPSKGHVKRSPSLVHVLASHSDNSSTSTHFSGSVHNIGNNLLSCSICAAVIGMNSRWGPWYYPKSFGLLTMPGGMFKKAVHQAYQVVLFG